MTDLVDRLPTDPPSSIVALYQGPLAGVRFPDVDGDLLRDLEATVRSATADVAAARAALVAAQCALGIAEQALVASEAALHERSARALAYARVFATAAGAGVDPSLRDALVAIDAATLLRPGAASPSAPPGAAAPRRRGRPRKVVATAPVDDARPLFAAGAPSNDAEVAAAE